MLIVFKIEPLLYELFPRFKESGGNIDVLKEEIKEQYSFGIYSPQVEINDGFVSITLDARQIENELPEFKKAVKFCEQGKFSKAKPILTDLINQSPYVSEYHRILGQIEAEGGKTDEAITHLKNALRWDPKNAFALTMLGNIMVRQKKDFESGLKYYDKAIEIDPGDNITLNNIGATLMNSGKLIEARSYLEKALEANPNYPNTYLALSLLNNAQNDLSNTFAYSIEAMKRSGPKDPIHIEALKTAEKTAKILLTVGGGALRRYEPYKAKVEKLSGKPIETLEDPSIPTAAKIEFAENYARDRHVVKYKPEYAAKEHLMMHELVHLQFACEARNEGVNKLFVSTQEQKSNFIKAHEKWITKASRKGIPEQTIATVIGELFDGLNRQIFNCPVDLFIEHYLHDEHPYLRPVQFLSLSAIVAEGLKAVTNKEVEKNTPSDVLENSKILNMVGAMQFKELYGVDLLEKYQASTSEMNKANMLYSQFNEMKNKRSPGDEYSLVDQWARELGLAGNFKLLDEREFVSGRERQNAGSKSEEEKHAATEEFVKQKQDTGTNMAVVMFMVDALQFFKPMPIEEVRNISFEIAMIGTKGISPAREDYKVGLVPDKTFSGYKLLAYYYVSWAIANPEKLNSLHLPFNDEYYLARKMFGGADVELDPKGPVQ